MIWNNLELPEQNVYFKDDDTVIYCASCYDILSDLPDSFDLIITDPPYPDQHLEYIGEQNITLDFLDTFTCRQLIFWSAKAEMPIKNHTAIHVWDKQVGCASEYELIYEYNGQANYKIFHGCTANNEVTAKLQYDVFTGHPSQKSRKVIDELVNYASDKGSIILDPFLGSGTTAYCAKKLGRKCIGIEIEEKYCKIAVERLMQSVMKL